MALQGPPRDHRPRRQRQGDRQDRRGRQATSEKAGPAPWRHAIWTTEGFPVNNDSQDDAGARPVQTTLPGGTIFRVIEFKPGVQARNHRTDSIDYIVVMAGEIDMEMDGTMVHLKAGDVLVQRGTIHNWINNGTESLHARRRS